MPALEQAIGEIGQARREWLARWEGQVLRLATGIAEKLIRRELQHDADIPLELLKEALELAAGSRRLRIRLNPADRESLGPAVEQIVARIAALASAEILADAEVSLGGCVVETEHGEIDQRFESQIARICEELL